MNDDKIIKALECCIVGSCFECPVHAEFEECMRINFDCVLDLINRQKAVIERLKAAKKLYLDRWGESIKLAREDEINSIKEFAERIKQYFNPDSSRDFREWVDNLVKEMEVDRQ